MRPHLVAQVSNLPYRRIAFGRASRFRNALDLLSPPRLQIRDTTDYNSAPRKNLSRGFTLIELMTVIVIIAIMTAMIIPEMKGSFEDALLRSTSRDLVSVFELASSRAISLNQMHRVRLDSATGRYVVERRVREGGLQSFIPLKDVSGCEGELDQRVAINIRRSDTPPPGAEGEVEAANLVDTVAFYPDGTCDSSVVMLQDRAGFRLALKLNSITSRVQVFELDKQ